MIEDYQQAGTIFDSLPLDKRATIKITAETKAETVRLTNQKRKKPGSNTTEQNTIASDSAAWDLGDPNSDEGIFNNKNTPVEKTATPGEQGLDTKNELDALKEEMQQALKG